MDQNEAGCLVDEREATLIKFDGSGQLIQKKGWFLRPNENIEESKLGVPFFPVLQRPCSDWISKLNFQVSFKGWPTPTREWIQWVQKLMPIYKDVWKEAGIFYALQVSTCNIRKDLTSIWEVLLYWNIDTNTFIFPFGEASITLEDTLVLGGFSPIGFCAREVGFLGEELDKLEIQLLTQHQDFNKAKTKKAGFSAWIKHFMKSNDVSLEHVAFLSVWLSRYVFRKAPGDVVQKELFPLAILLAQGKRFALGPAVLASIYRDMRLLKELLHSNEKGDILPIFAPFYIVQMWVSDHFLSNFQNVIPNLIEHDKPWATRWHDIAIKRPLGSRLVCESTCDFQWRPYATKSYNWSSPSYYRENGQWIYGKNMSDEATISFAQCLRACEMVGLDSIQLYLPQRVSRHFGYDQDLLGCAHVDGRVSDWRLAWANYTKYDFSYVLYVPPRDYESNVTYQYYSWWKGNFSSFSCFEINVGMLKKGKRKEISVVSRRQEPMLQLDLNTTPLSIEFLDLDELPRCNLRIIKRIARASSSAALSQNQLTDHANREASLAATGEVDDRKDRLHELENTEHEALYLEQNVPTSLG